jgi:hypothetical protein
MRNLLLSLTEETRWSICRLFPTKTYEWILSLVLLALQKFPSFAYLSGSPQKTVGLKLDNWTPYNYEQFSNLSRFGRVTWDGKYHPLPPCKVIPRSLKLPHF